MFVDSAKTSKYIYKKISPSGSQTIIDFSILKTKHHGNIPTGTPLAEASNAGTNRDRRRYSWLSIDDMLDLRTSATIHRAV